MVGVFERFTDRARRVLVLAQEEARLLDHDFIGTEHLLLGLIREEEGVAARALASLGVTYEGVQRAAQEEIGPRLGHASASPPFTPRAKKVLELSLREALARSHNYNNYIGTEHLLLGLLQEGGGVAATVLTKLGFELDAVCQRVIDLMEGSPEARLHSEAAKQERLHILAGLLRAIDELDAIQAAVRGCPDRRAAVKVLMAPPFGYSEAQIRPVLDLRVESLTAHRIRSLHDEVRELELPDQPDQR
jgi:ATP-dependent Clp protease ATP-binding subunit ClpA